jgi:ubiquinone/menaquinone biosynthesis C-methylase UbiE
LILFNQKIKNEFFRSLITDNRIEEAKTDNIKFYSSNLIDCRFPENFFDIVYLDSVLEHVLNPLEYLLEIKRILKKGGVIYVGIPDEDSLLNDIKKSLYLFKGSKLSPKLRPFESPYHVVGFNRKSIKFTLELVQLDIKSIRNFACRLEFLKSRPFSKPFFHSLLLLPIYLLAVPLRKEVYQEVYAQNK